MKLNLTGYDDEMLNQRIKYTRCDHKRFNLPWYTIFCFNQFIINPLNIFFHAIL